MTSVRTVAARKTSVRELPLATALTFVAAHHRAGSAQPGKNARALSLELDGETLAVAIFSNPRTRAKQREYTTELFRLAFKGSTRIQGGASKLIKAFLKTGPADLFTYQDTSGESTNVYEHAGLTLVGKSNPTKRILVRDGLTAKTATNNRSDWFSLEQVANLGPDKLLGTKLGEVYEEGKRVSNMRLFQREGYHLETIPGDRVYQWRNPAIRFYTYRITSSDDAGYYYGRHRTSETSPEAMQADGYMGSGGKKFQNWLSSVNKSSLHKEILGVQSTWPESIAAEEALIGEAYRTDPNCKNSRPGGTGLTGYFPDHHIATCPVHGETKHMGDSCKKCAIQKSLLTAECPKHGETTFRSGVCLKCQSAKSRSVRICVLHGETKHHGETCDKCAAAELYSLKECPTHGLSQHMGDSCKKCVANAAITMQTCPVHGETKHVGSICRKCIASNAMTLKSCPTHGEVLHQGNRCVACTGAKRVNVQKCPLHGEVKFLGNTCATCVASKGVNLQTCSVHGETKHMGDRCKKCMAAKVWTVEECSVHGEVKHRSGRCVRCTLAASKTKAE